MLNLRELFTAGIAFHKFSLNCFVCTDQCASGQQCMKVRKAIIPDWNVTRMKRKLIELWLCFEKLPQNQNYSTNFNDLGIIIILFRRQCFIWRNQNILYFRISIIKFENRAFRYFWDTLYSLRDEIAYPTNSSNKLEWFQRFNLNMHGICFPAYWTNTI